MEHLVNTERFAGGFRGRKSRFLDDQEQQMLLRKVEKFMARHDMPATKFGRLAAHDPRFVLDLRMGRIPRPDTERRTLRWMDRFEEAALSAQASFAARCHAENRESTHAA